MTRSGPWDRDIWTDLETLESSDFATVYLTILKVSISPLHKENSEASLGKMTCSFLRIYIHIFSWPRGLYLELYYPQTKICWTWYGGKGLYPRGAINLARSCYSEAGSAGVWSGGRDIRLNNGEFIDLRAYTWDTRFTALAKSLGDGIDVLLG